MSATVSRQESENQTQYAVRALQHDAWFQGARTWSSQMINDEVLCKLNPYRDDMVGVPLDLGQDSIDWWKERVAADELCWTCRLCKPEGATVPFSVRHGPIGHVEMLNHLAAAHEEFTSE